MTVFRAWKRASKSHVASEDTLEIDGSSGRPHRYQGILENLSKTTSLSQFAPKNISNQFIFLYPKLFPVPLFFTGKISSFFLFF